MHGQSMLSLSCLDSSPGLCACCLPLPAVPRAEMGDGRKIWWR